MRRIVLESPYAGEVERNVHYARCCMAHALSLGEAPFSSALLYTQPGVLDDSDPNERLLGIRAGFAWRWGADATVVYTDLGVSDGMQSGIEHAAAVGQTVEFRRLPGWAPSFDGEEMMPVEEPE